MRIVIALLLVTGSFAAEVPGIHSAANAEYASVTQPAAAVVGFGCAHAQFAGDESGGRPCMQLADGVVAKRPAIAFA